MFFDDLPLKKHTRLRQPPPIPGNGWQPPKDFPNLSSAVVIGLDTEEKETDFAHGPGWRRGKGHIVGVSLAAEDAQGNRGVWYFPCRHEAPNAQNIEPARLFPWLKYVLEQPTTKVGANLIYDVGWLTEENIWVGGKLYDVQYAEALLSENSPVALDYLAWKYLGRGKVDDTLYKWLSQAFGGPVNDTQRGNIWRAPTQLVGPYAEGDATLPLDILAHQWRELERQNLLDLFELECGLIRLLVEMRLAGMPVDVPRAEQMYVDFGRQIEEDRAKLKYETGVDVDATTPTAQVAQALGAIGINVPLTPTGKPTVKDDWLKVQEHPVPKLIKAIREQYKLRSTFIRSYILESHVDGKLFCQFHPLRDQEGGTRSGRFSSSDPNLQNIPARSNVGKELRKLFIAEKGHAGIRCHDYSQIEYRFLAHYAVGPGSDELRARYVSDPNTDYHEATQTLTKEKTGRELERKPIKNINFGLLYGMGKAKLARQLGIAMQQALPLFKAYHEGNPYVQATMDAVSNEARVNGYITTILGRRSRFELWTSTDRSQGGAGLPYEQALALYGSSIEPAYTHKAINRRLQGSAADIMKKSMLQCYTEGVFDYIGVPRITVHDENVWSQKDRSREQEEAFAYMQHVFETSIPLRVPIMFDGKFGPNWGDTTSL